MEFTIRIGDGEFDSARTRDDAGTSTDGRYAGIDPRVRRLLTSDDPTVRDALAQFALEEMLDWLAGRTAYQSVTQQQTQWIERLLPEFFPDRPPTPSQIYSTFSIPYGRAAYIARVIAESQNSHWRRKGRETLRAVLAERRDEAAGLDATTDIVIHLDTFAVRELTVVVDEVFADPGVGPDGDVPIAPPSVREISSGRFEVRLQAWLVIDALHELGER